MSLQGDEVPIHSISMNSRLCSWSQEFLKLGGYAALLTRLNEILEVEWRLVAHVFTIIGT